MCFPSCRVSSASILSLLIVSKHFKQMESKEPSLFFLCGKTLGVVRIIVRALSGENSKIQKLCLQRCSLQHTTGQMFFGFVLSEQKTGDPLKGSPNMLIGSLESLGPSAELA
jgi:hypothetical protein